MGKVKKKRTKKWVKGIILVALIDVILLLLVLSYTVIIPTKPKQNEVLEGRDVDFEWIGKKAKYWLIVDDNPEFTSPWIIETRKNRVSVKNMSVGENWWYVMNERARSKVRMFRIIPNVIIEVDEDNQSYTVKNKGNVALNLSIELKNPVTGAVILALPYKDRISFEKENVTSITASQR